MTKILHIPYLLRAWLLSNFNNPYVRYLVSYLHLVKNRILSIILFLKKHNLLPSFVTKFVLGYDYESIKFENVFKYALLHPDKTEIIYNQPVSLSYCIPQFNVYNPENNIFKNVEGFKKYCVILNDVEVIGGSNVVICDKKKALYDIKFLDANKIMKYTDYGIRYYSDDYLLVWKIKSELTFDKAIFLGGNFSENYFHLFYEIFSKFYLLRDLNINPCIPILIDKNCLQVTQFNELLSLLNAEKRKIILIDKGIRYKVNKLYYFSLPNIIPPHLNVAIIKSEDILFNLDSLKFLRDNLLPSASQNIFPKRIFISRKNASWMRKFNEDDVFNVLKKHEFQIIFPEDYSFIDQISLFNNAEFIAGGSGAAFTNLLFCKNSCKIIIFFKSNMPFSIWSTIAKFVGANVLYVTENSKKSKNIHKSFTIDTIKLESLVSDWLY